MNTFYVCIALLGLLVFALGILVSVGRGKFNVLIGYPTDPESTMHKWVRAHANTTEYAPALMILMYILSLSPTSGWVVWFAILATACRFLFVAGILLPKTLAKPNPMRFLGALGTYVFGIGLAIALLQRALGAN